MATARRAATRAAAAGAKPKTAVKAARAGARAGMKAAKLGAKTGMKAAKTGAKVAKGAAKVGAKAAKKGAKVMSGGLLGKKDTRVAQAPERIADYGVQCLDFVQATGTLHGCQRWLFGAIDPDSGEFSASFALQEATQLVQCGGQDVAEVGAKVEGD